MQFERNLQKPRNFYSLKICRYTVRASWDWKLLYCHIFTAINIGFGQERYTVSEADVAGGGMMRIPIIKENDQQSEVTFEVLATLLTGSGLNAAVEGMNGDFQANTTQSQDFVPDEQVIYFQFELFDDELPEPVEQFEIQLSLPDVAGLTGINLGGSLFPRATVVIVDNDGEFMCVSMLVCRPAHM